jgi:signal transduction histidine kinase/DNA-binding NarL/FixJ family response regulator
MLSQKLPWHRVRTRDSLYAIESVLSNFRASVVAMHMLILDADPIVLTALADTVRRRLPGVEVHAASSLHAGLKKLAHAHCDVIVSDARLPDAPGVACISILRQRHPDIPIILMSSELGQDLMAYAILSGVYFFLHKPIEPNVLMAMLNRVIEQSRFDWQTHQLTRKVNRHTKRARKAIAYARLLLEAKERVLIRRQETLAESEHTRNRLAKTLETFRHGVLALDRAWRIAWLNGSVPDLFRLKGRDELLGKGLWEEYSDLVGSQFEQECHRAVREQLPVHFQARFAGEDQWYDVDAVPHEDGLSVFLLGAAIRQSPGSARREQKTVASLNVSHPLSSDHEGTAAIDRDHRQEEGHRRSLRWDRLSEQVLMAREAERARIARDLHDDLGQLLMALKTDLAWLDARLPQEQLPALLKVRFMTHLVDRITDTIQRICSELRPEILDDLDLAAAIQWQASIFEHRAGLRCIVSIKDIDRIDGELSTGLFRIVQQLLTNVAFQARASIVWVTLKKEAGWLILEVSDNGRGLRDSDTPPTSHNLLSLRERVMLLRGELTINGMPGQGSSVSVKIPTSGTKHRSVQ